MDNGYDLKIFIVINAHKKHNYVFYQWFNEHDNQVNKHKLQIQHKKIKNKILQIYNIKNIIYLNITHS
jgi:hypothetical protein